MVSYNSAKHERNPNEEFVMIDGKRAQFELEVDFFDSWSDSVTLDEVVRSVAERPERANQYHVACTNITYAQFIDEHSHLIERVRTALATTQSTQHLYESIVALCQREFGAQASALLLEDADRVHLRAIAASGYARDLLTREATYEVGQGITGKVWETGKTVKCDSHEAMVGHPWRTGKHDKLQWSDGTRCENLVFVALQDHAAGHAFGVLKLENKQQNLEYTPFSDEDVATLKLVASLIANSVLSAMSIEQETERNPE